MDKKINSFRIDYINATFMEYIFTDNKPSLYCSDEYAFLDPNGDIEIFGNRYSIPKSIHVTQEMFKYENFHNMKQLENIEFDDDVTEIPEYAFQACKYLKNISGGKNIIKIGDCAFQFLNAVENFNLNTENKIIVGRYAFSDYNTILPFKKKSIDIRNYYNGFNEKDILDLSDTEEIYITTYLSNFKAIYFPKEIIINLTGYGYWSGCFKDAVIFYNGYYSDFIKKINNPQLINKMKMLVCLYDNKAIRRKNMYKISDMSIDNIKLFLDQYESGLIK